VEDRCVDEPDLHQHTLDSYPDIFDRTTTDVICSDYSKWLVALEEIDGERG
jgi:hypothetical protein